MKFYEKIRSTLGGSILCASLFLAGCAYKPFFSKVKNPNFIASVKTETYSEKNLDEYFDYGKLSWEETIRFVKTPEEAQLYNDWLLRNVVDLKKRKFDNGTHIYSFKRIHEGSRVDCTEGAAAAAALLSDNGYPPLVLRICESFFSNHVVFIYKENGKFGSVGLYRMDYTGEQESLEEVIKSLYGGKTFKYEVYNLKKNFPGFIDGDSITTFFPAW